MVRCPNCQCELELINPNQTLPKEEDVKDIHKDIQAEIDKDYDIKVKKKKCRKNIDYAKEGK